jgi:hypothetical protein
MPDVLCATFDRAPGRWDRIKARRSDGSEVSWEVPTYRASLPHDLVHLVVESAFELRLGLWGHVDRGRDPAKINEAASRARGGDRSYGFGDDLEELLMAEGLTAVHWYDPALEDASVCEDIIDRCAEFGVGPPPTLAPTRVGVVRAVLRAERARFREAGGRRVATFSFDVGNPGASLVDLHGPFMP